MHDGVVERAFFGAVVDLAFDRAAAVSVVDVAVAAAAAVPAGREVPLPG